eukprot:g75287.t1
MEKITIRFSKESRPGQASMRNLKNCQKILNFCLYCFPNNMGAQESLPAPWEILGVKTDALTAEQKERLSTISKSASSFLEGNAKYFPGSEFSLSSQQEFLDGALLHDPLLQRWLPKLVPKRVSEENFWRNYFSHVASVLADSSSTSLAPFGAAADAGVGVGGSTAVQQAAPVSKRAGSVVGPPASNGHKTVPSQREFVSTESLPPAARGPSPTVTAFRSPSPPVAAGPVPPSAQAAPLGTVRWGIIGCELIESEQLTALCKKGRGRVVAVMSLQLPRAQAFAKQFNIPRAYGDSSSLAHDPDVDAVYVATPQGTHLLYADLLVKSGKPALFEAPLGRSLVEAERIRDSFQSANLQLYVGYALRAQPRARAVRLALLGGAIGTLTSVHYQYQGPQLLGGSRASAVALLSAERSGGGLFVYHGGAVIDLLDYFLGPLGHVTGDAVCNAVPEPSPPSDKPVQVETSVVMTFRVAGLQSGAGGGFEQSDPGALGTASWNFTSAAAVDELQLVGTGGRIRIAVFDAGTPLLELPDDSAPYKWPHIPAAGHPLGPLLSAITKDLATRGRSRGPQPSSRRISTGRSACRTAAVMDAALRKYYRSREDEFWRRPQTWGQICVRNYGTQMDGGAAKDLWLSNTLCIVTGSKLSSLIGTSNIVKVTCPEDLVIGHSCLAVASTWTHMMHLLRVSSC